MVYKQRGTKELLGYTESDYIGDQNDRKNTPDYIFVFSNGAVSWYSKKQQVVTLLTNEAEFIVIVFSACHAV